MRGTDPIKSTWEYPNWFYHISIMWYVMKHVIDLKINRCNSVLFYLIYFIFVDSNDFHSLNENK